MVQRLYAQKPNDKNKCYARHAPEMACLVKARPVVHLTRSVATIGSATTNHEEWVLVAGVFEDNPWSTMKQATAVSRLYMIVAVDRTSAFCFVAPHKEENINANEPFLLAVQTKIERQKFCHTLNVI